MKIRIPERTGLPASPPSATRAAVGDGLPHGRPEPVVADARRCSPALDATQVRRIAAELAELGVFWLEEPLPGGDLDGMRALRGLDPGGRRARWPGPRPNCSTRSAGALDVLQPDVVLSVGMLRTRTIAELALLRHRWFTPHTWTNGLGLLANLHVVAGLGGGPYVEFPYDPPGWTEERRDFFLHRAGPDRCRRLPERPRRPRPGRQHRPRRRGPLRRAAQAISAPSYVGACAGQLAGGQACAVSDGESTLITGIGELVTNDGEADDGEANDGEPGAFAAMSDAALVIAEGKVAWTGPAARAPAADAVVDAAGRAVLPGFADSHAHLVFAGERSGEFAARMAGRPYRAGGILVTVEATRAASDAALRANLRRLVTEMLRQGTTTFECKSGYGLTVPDEARGLALAAEVTPEVTYLGAHVVPPEFAADPAGYVDLVCGPMLDACAPSARWVDVFCEDGAFGADEAAAVLAAGRAAGLSARVHANQLGPGPGVRVAAEAGAASADHCTFLTDDDVDALVSTPVVATLLPGVEFSCRQPFPQARRLLDAGATVALATDCNPGSSFTSSMPFCIALAVREMRMTTEEAVWSATAGGARALRRTDIGHLGAGARADLILLDAPSHAYLAYRPGVPQIAAVWQAGRLVAGAVP